MIGDHLQLNPLVKSGLADKKGMTVSIFEKLTRKHNDMASTLRFQYRMNDAILSLSNQLTYDNIMEHDNEEIKQAKLEIRASSEKPYLEFVKGHKVTFINTDSVVMEVPEEEREETKNKTEIKCVKSLVKFFKEGGIDVEKQAKVITPFLEQSHQL
jgi:superfamily I DNA and/or RNA helicase